MRDFQSTIIEARRVWLEENDPQDGTDCVTPFDKFLYDQVDEKMQNLVTALQLLDKAASEVARLGAVMGPQWSKLTIASLKARAALAAFKEGN